MAASSSNPPAPESKEHKVTLIGPKAGIHLIFDDKSSTTYQEMLAKDDFTRIFNDARSSIPEADFMSHATIPPLTPEALEIRDTLTGNETYKEGYSRFDKKGEFNKRWKGKLFGKDEKAVLAFIKWITQEIARLSKLSEFKDFYSELKSKGHTEIEAYVYLQSAIFVAIQYQIDAYAKRLDLQNDNPPEDPRQTYHIFYNSLIGRFINDQYKLYLDLIHALKILQGKKNDELSSLLTSAHEIGNQSLTRFNENICIDPASEITLVKIASDLVDADPALLKTGKAFLEKSIASYKENHLFDIETSQNRLIERHKCFHALMDYRKSEQKQDVDSLFTASFNEQLLILAKHLLIKNNVLNNNIVLFMELIDHLKKLRENPENIIYIKKFINYSTENGSALQGLAKEEPDWTKVIGYFPNLISKYGKILQDNSNSIDNNLLNEFILQQNLLKKNLKQNGKRIKNHSFEILMHNGQINERNRDLLLLANAVLEIPKKWNRVFSYCNLYLSALLDLKNERIDQIDNIKKLSENLSYINNKILSSLPLWHQLKIKKQIDAEINKILDVENHTFDLVLEQLNHFLDKEIRHFVMEDDDSRISVSKRIALA